MKKALTAIIAAQFMLSALARVMICDSNEMLLDATVGDTLSIEPYWHTNRLVAIRLSTVWDGGEDGLLSINGIDETSVSTAEEKGFLLTVPVNSTNKYECVFATDAVTYKRTIVTTGARRWTQSRSAMLDTYSSPRTVESGSVENIRYSSLWDSDETATATVALNGTEVKSASGEGEYEWTVPIRVGEYRFTHTTAKEGSQVGETLTATFVVAMHDMVIDDGNNGEGGENSRFSYSGVYDGKGHGISVVVNEEIESPTISYSHAKTGPYCESLLITNVCEKTPVWYTIAAADYNTYTNWATVTITPKPISDATILKTFSPAMYSSSGSCPKVKVADTAIAADLTVTAYAAGDVDGDGVLSENDVTLIKKYNAYQKLSDENKAKFSSYNLTGDALTAADVNKDGQVNADDVTALQDKFGCYEMVEGTDYAVAYSDNTKAGTGHVTITGKGNYGGTVTLDFEIQKATIGEGDEPGSGTVPAGGKSKYDATVVYDGEGHTVNTNALALAKIGSDSFTVAYSLDGANGWQIEPFVYTNAGQYVFWYRLQNENYNDYVHQVQLTITPKLITDSTVAKALTPASFVYDGTAKTPTVTITDESVFRWQFVVAYAAGDVNGDGVLAQGDADAIDQYVAYLELDDDMKPLFEEYALMGDALAAADYNGDGVVDAVDVTDLEASFVTLKEGVDYTVAYENNIEAGTAKVIVKGMGNYGGTATPDFEIEPLVSVKNLKVTQIAPMGLALDFDVDGAVANYALEVKAITQGGAVTNVAKTLSGDVGCSNGAHRVYWNTAKDGISIERERAVIEVGYKAGDQSGKGK